MLYGIFFGIVLIKFRPAAKTAQPTRKETTTETPKPSLPSANQLMLTTFFFALLIFWLMYQQWSSNLSVYMTGLGILLRNYSFLWTLNAALIGTIPCQVDTYKNENTIFLIRPNRGNIPPRFGHFF
ncbi:MFS transporter [Lacticaseibacillus paracasei]|nr:MFS transporter [Lacticaseibacillus paracasei]